MPGRFGAVVEPGLDPPAQLTLGSPERLHVLELDLVAFVPPRRVVAVLLATAAVEACRLQVSVGARSDPDHAPRRRDRQPPDPLEHDAVLDGGLALVEIDEACTGPHPLQ